MTARDLLEALRGDAEHMTRRREEIERLRALAEKMTASYGTSGGSKSGVSDKVGALAAKLADLENEYSEAEALYVARLTDAMELLRGVSAQESSVCYDFYILGMGTAAIAAKIGYTEGYVKQLKHAALVKLEAVCYE